MFISAGSVFRTLRTGDAALVRTAQRLHEQIAIFRHLQSLDWCTENANAEAVEHAHLVKFDADVERGLRGVQTVSAAEECRVE